MVEWEGRGGAVGKVEEGRGSVRGGQIQGGESSANRGIGRAPDIYRFHSRHDDARAKITAHCCVCPEKGQCLILW